MRSESAHRLLASTSQEVKNKVLRMADKIVFKNRLLSLPCKNPLLRNKLKKI